QSAPSSKKKQTDGSPSTKHCWPHGKPRGSQFNRRLLKSSVADWDAANPNWRYWFEYRLFKAVQKELDRPDQDLPVLEKGEVSGTGIGVLLQLIGKMIGNAHKILGEDIRELAARCAALKERAASADEERGKLQAALDSKQKQLDELQSANALLLNRITKLEAASTADARVSDIEQRLALQQIERDKAKRGAKGNKGEKGERGPQGAQGPPGKLITPPEIVAWEYDIENFKAAPLLEDGRMGAPLNVQPFLEQFINGTLQGMFSNMLSEVDDQVQ